MQRTAKARLFLFWVLPATLLRGSTICAGRQLGLSLGGLSTVEPFGDGFSSSALIGGVRWLGIFYILHL
jgi:hypothetical protein